MAKKDKYYSLAERMYVEEQVPITGISSRLCITEATLHKWKKEGEWERKKTAFLKSQYSCHAELYELVRKMTKKISEDYEQGISPDAGTLYFLKSMADKLPKLKAFEEAAIQTAQQENKAESTNGDLSVRIAELVDAKLTGDL